MPDVNTTTDAKVNISNVDYSPDNKIFTKVETGNQNFPERLDDWHKIFGKKFRRKPRPSMKAGDLAPTKVILQFIVHTDGKYQ